MKTIKVSFDYDRKHYDLKVQIKLDRKSETGLALTKRDYNNDWELLKFDGIIAAWNGDEQCPYTFELELSRRTASALHLRVWMRHGDGVLLDDEGGVENYDIVEYGYI